MGNSIKVAVVLTCFLFFTITQGQLLMKKNDIKVLIGREAFLSSEDLQFYNTSDGEVCKVEVVQNEPITQRVGLFEPQVFDCEFIYGTIKYTHHGSPLLSNDTVKLRAYKFLENDTISQYFDLLVIIVNSSYNIIQPANSLIVKEFLGLSEPIDDAILNFNYSRKEGSVCKVRMSRHILHKPAYGKVVIGKEKRSIDVIKRRCDDFLQLGLRYEHLGSPSPNIDYILIIVEVNDPDLSDGFYTSEWYHIPIIIEPGFPNLRPKASFSGMYLMDVDQFIITAITPAVLSATDSETPSDELIFNISKPLLLHQGSIVHLSDHTRAVSSFSQKDLNNFDIAYKPPSRSFKERQMFDVGFIIFDPDFSHSEPFTMHIAVRPAITSAPRVSMNVGIVLLEGQSRPLSTNNLEIVDSDNIEDIKVFVTGGLYHGRLEVHNKPAVSFTRNDIASGSVIYHHDDSDSTRDSIHLRIFDGSFSTHTKVPITIIPKDDSPPTLIINIGLKVHEGGSVQISPSTLRTIDYDTTDEFVSFTITILPSYGKLMKRVRKDKIGYEVLNFTQKDINKGLIYYQHNGNEIFTDSFDVVLQDINKPPNTSPPYKINVRVLPVGDDPPKRDPASLFTLEVQETDIGIFGSQHLRFMDFDSRDSEIIYSITSLPRFIGSFAYKDPGKIVLLTDESLQKDAKFSSILYFTQAQVNHHKVAYLPPADEIGPNPLYLQFIFSVTDKDNNTVTGQIFNITILPVNNKIPQLHTGELLVEEGSSTLLSTNELSVYDSDTLTSDLQMSLFTIPLHGVLQRSSQPLRVGDLLSLDDILTLRLEYVHDGSESFEDGFKIGVNDGLHFVSGVVTISIEPIDDENPLWIKKLQPRISINEGGSVKITPQILAATDIDTDDSLLHFILTEGPSYGSIMLDKKKVNRFSQKDILFKEVEYTHNGQEVGPNPKEDALTFIVTDKSFPRLMPHDSHKVLITILPVNNRPPRLYFKRAILVEEGQSVTITEDNLSATDDDTFPAELLLVISKQPKYGYLENLRPTPGYEKNAAGKRINAFPLQDVKDGFVSFVQSEHRNIEPESDGFEVFVTDGIFNSTSVLVFVSIVLLNDEVPEFSISNITVNEGGDFIFNNESIIASDQDFPDDILVVSVQHKPKHGKLTYQAQAVNNGPLIEIPFDQLSLESFENIIYKHDGSENFFDSFTLSLFDGYHTLSRTCFVSVKPVNDEPPKLLKNITADNVEFHGAHILSAANLLAVDEDSSPNEIFYNVTSPFTHGVLERKNKDNQWEELDSLMFSQEEVNSNLIRYRHTSDQLIAYEDNFKFKLNDGVHETAGATFKIKLVDSGKTTFTLLNFGANVTHGESIVINSSLLHAEDNSSRIKDIFFNVLRLPMYGHLLLNRTHVFVGQKIDVLDVMNNMLVYQHNDSAKVTSDNFQLTASNGVIARNFTFNLTVVGVMNKIPILEAILPLHVNPHDKKSYLITSHHLLSYQPLVSDNKIQYHITEFPKYGTIVHKENHTNPSKFSQEEVNNRFISYIPFTNGTYNDSLYLKVSNNEQDGYLYSGKLMFTASVLPIHVNSTPNLFEPVVFINSPSDLERVWKHHLGFYINSYNLKASVPGYLPNDIKFHVSKYLKHGYIFHLKEQKVIKVFTQEDIREQFIVVILKRNLDPEDYFTFYITADKVTFKKEFRIDFKWAVVYFPFPEYSVCEDSIVLNVEILRKGNVDVSSYVTVTAIEQTAKEGLDFVSRRINKVQFDPGVTNIGWKIMIVQDNLEEAPIEQLQIILSDSENCLIYSNRTIVSIYDLDRDACAQIPVVDPFIQNFSPQNKNMNHGQNTDDDFGKESIDISEYDFPMVCHPNIYELLHFQQSTQKLFQCDGKNWVPWVPKDATATTNFEYSSSLGNDVNQDKEDLEITTVETSYEETSLANIPETGSCYEGWNVYLGKCHKWFRQPATWTDAQKICTTYASAELVVVESSEHNSWLLQLARGKPYWIGLYAPSDTNEWSYKLEKSIPYENWKKGFPRAPINGEMKHRCVLVRGSGHWINKNCDLHEHSYICSMPIDNM